MEPIGTSRSSTRRRSSSYKLVFISLGVVAVISPLYINTTPVADSEVEQPTNLVSWLPLLLTLAVALSLYLDGGITRISSYKKFVGLGLGLVAVASPLYIDREPEYDLEAEEQSFDPTSWLPLLLLVLILAIALSLYLDQSLTRFDPYWIHRVGGSSGGIILILAILALVLKCKAFHGVKPE